MTEWLHFLSFYSSFWSRKWQPTPVFLPGESHGQRGLVGYSLWGCKELDTTKQLTHNTIKPGEWSLETEVSNPDSYVDCCALPTVDTTRLCPSLCNDVFSESITRTYNWREIANLKWTLIQKIQGLWAQHSWMQGSDTCSLNHSWTVWRSAPALGGISSLEAHYLPFPPCLKVEAVERLWVILYLFAVVSPCHQQPLCLAGGVGERSLPSAAQLILRKTLLPGALGIKPLAYFPSSFQQGEHCRVTMVCFLWKFWKFSLLEEEGIEYRGS